MPTKYIITRVDDKKTNIKQLIPATGNRLHVKR